MTNLNPNSVIYIAEKILGLDLLSNSRKEEYIEGRAIVYYILRHKLGMTYQQIAKVFNKNHATVLHALKEWPYMVKYNSQLDAKKDQVVDYINENCTPDKDGRKDIKIKACEDQIFLLNSKIKELKKELNELYNKKHARRL
tara:strand:- start:388 stop:810 length:423 start_codon:yes stop_codon:yes gene_type:complete